MEQQSLQFHPTCYTVFQEYSTCSYTFCLLKNRRLLPFFSSFKYVSHLAAQGKLGRQEVRHRSTIKQKKNLVNFQNKRPPADYMLCLSNAHCVILRYFYIFKYSPWQEQSDNMSSKYLKITFKKIPQSLYPAGSWTMYQLKSWYYNPSDTQTQHSVMLATAILSKKMQECTGT